jgi:hypothetical protein
MSSPTGQPLKMLASYAYFSTARFGRILDELHSAGPTMMFGDSGAHSARTLGITLTLEDYAAWCHRYDQRLTLYANLDVIGAPEATWNNQRALEDQHGLLPLPVFHTGEPWHHLERYLDHGHTYIALGKLLGNPVADVLSWLDRVFTIAGNHAVFHGFGMTVLSALRRFPFYSVDSSTWSGSVRFGIVKLFDDTRGTWVNLLLRDKAAVLAHRDLIRAHHADPRVLATRAAQDRTSLILLAATAWRRAEAYIRRIHGPISIPPSTHNPVTRHGAPAPPGLHLCLADASSTNLRAARHIHTHHDRTPV